MIRWCPNGATPCRRAGPRGRAEGTGGTETSHVPRGTERIPVVAASEPGGAQTTLAVQAAADASVGLDAMSGGLGRALAPTQPGAERCWNGRPERVRVP